MWAKKPIVEMPCLRAKAHRQIPRAIRERLIKRVAILMSEMRDVLPESLPGFDIAPFWQNELSRWLSLPGS